MSDPAPAAITDEMVERLAAIRTAAQFAVDCRLDDFESAMTDYRLKTGPQAVLVVLDYVAALSRAPASPAPGGLETTAEERATKNLEGWTAALVDLKAANETIAELRAELARLLAPQALSPELVRLKELAERLRETFTRRRYGGLATDTYDPDLDLFDVAADAIDRLLATKAGWREPDYIYSPADTINWADRDDLINDIDLDYSEIRELGTLIEGPKKYVVRVVISRDAEGDAEEAETRLFNTRAEAEAAVALPLPPTQDGQPG